MSKTQKKMRNTESKRKGKKFPLSKWERSVRLFVV